MLATMQRLAPSFMLSLAENSFRVMPPTIGGRYMRCLMAAVLVLGFVNVLVAADDKLDE